MIKKTRIDMSDAGCVMQTQCKAMQCNASVSKKKRKKEK